MTDRSSPGRRSKSYSVTTEERLWSFWETAVDGWTVAVRVQMQRQRLVVSEVRIFPPTDLVTDGPGGGVGEWTTLRSELEASEQLEGGITTGLIRDLHLGAIFEMARADAVETLRIVSDAGYDDPAIAERVATAARRPGRAGRDADFFLGVAVQYANLVTEGHPKPVVAMAKRRADGMSVETIKDWVKKARQLGFLTAPREPGKPGGELTPLALEQLRTSTAPEEQPWRASTD